MSRLRELPIAARLAVLAVLASIVCGLTWLLAEGPNSLGWTGLLLETVGIVLASMAFGILAGRMFCSDPVRSPMRSYNRRIAITMLIYAVALVGSVFLHTKGWSAGPSGYLLAALPALPIGGVFLVLGLYLKEEGDEFMRQLFVWACLIGAAATFIEATFLGFLEVFGKVAHAPAYWMSIAFFAQFGVANVLLRWRSR
jgi:hypothetical protein